MNPLIVIPARLAATRLPNKPLADIHGQPMIVHVLRVAEAANIGPVVVACGEAAIAKAVEAAGGRAVMTDPALSSGSDRVHAAAAAIDPNGEHDLVINVQGDFPTLDPALIRATLEPFALPDPPDVATLVTEVVEEDERYDHDSPKAIIDWRADQRVGRAAYFTRGTIPKDGGPHWHHIGIYAFRRAALARFVSAAPSDLEQREKLEQLRALAMGMRIDVVKVGGTVFGVDTSADLRKARRLLAPGVSCGEQALPTVIAYQGMPGANSDVACRLVYPALTPLPCQDFETALAAVPAGRARLAMIPVENTIAGRVADIHHLLPSSDMSVIGEHFQRVEHCLVAPKGASLTSIKHVYSHIHALGQSRQYLRTRGYEPRVAADTAGAAAMVAERGDPACAAISTQLAAQLYGLEILASNIEDHDHNVTRFLIMAPKPAVPALSAPGPIITSFFFQVRSVSAALYKALGGFATNGVNMVRLESYHTDSRFTQAQFHADIDGHVDDPAVKAALDELRYFATYVRIIGVYPAHPFRTGKPPALSQQPQS